jgi:putative DNA primase/helicase
MAVPHDPNAALPGSPPSAQDLADHGEYGTPQEMVYAACRSVTDWEARNPYGIRFHAGADCSGLVYIYFDPVTGYRVTVRLRRRHPEINEYGKPENKYLSPYGDNRHLFFPPGTGELLADPKTVIVLVESEKAAMAMTAWARRMGLKLVGVAMGGCWGWRSQRARSVEMADGSWERLPGVVDDLKFCNGHPVVVMLDSNWHIEINPKVYWARAELTVEMSKPERRCDVSLCDLPVEDGINGPDDYLAAHDDQAMAKLFAQAHKPAYKSRQQQDEAEAAQAAAAIAVVRSQDALALKFTHLHPGLRYTALHGLWRGWDEHRWAPDSTCYVFDLVRNVCRAEAATCPSVTLARVISSAAMVAAVERLARADRRHAATVDQWDRDLWLLNTPSGVVDLRTGILRPARREDYQTKITAVAPGGGCPLWLAFLKRIMADDQMLVAYLQRWCGYSLTGVTTEHAMEFLFGTGANGKGTFVDTISGLLGDYARTASIDTFLDSKNDRHPTELAWLQGARFVTATETEQGRRWSEAKFKNLTGGDPVAARFMRQDFFEFVPQFKLTVQGNQKPGLRSVDEAIRRRFNLVPFVVTIPKEERDLALKEKLHAEWGGILAWAIEGCLDWQEEGLNPPEAVTKSTAEYFAQEDAIGRWIDDCADLRRDIWELTSELWESWRRWADANGEMTGSKKEFSQALQSRGLVPNRKNAGRVFEGIALRGPAGSVRSNGSTTYHDDREAL